MIAPKHRPRVAHVIDSMSISGGTELNAVRIIEHLKIDNDIVVVTFNAKGGMAARYERAGIEVVEFPISSLVNKTGWRQSKAMAAFFRSRSIDIVHAHDSYSNFLAPISARLAGIRGIIASKRWIQTLRWQHRWTNIIGYRLAHRVLANSSEVGRSLVQSDLVSKSRVAVVPNFVDDERFATPSLAEIARVRNGFGYSDEHVVVGIVAQLRAEKRHIELIDAFQKSVRKLPYLRLLIVGDGQERERITQHVRTCELGGLVTLAGHMSDGVAAHSAADISVLVSAHEGFPNSLVEAMAASRPVIATRVGGVVDAVDDGVTGILLPLPDEGHLERAIDRLAADASLRKSMGEAGREKAWNEYRRSLIIPRLQMLYDELSTR